jgi:hypothetical protein
MTIAIVTHYNEVRSSLGLNADQQHDIVEYLKSR